MALDLAALGLGRTSPNPPVGCVIVRDGTVVGRGHHARAGEPHAEVHALREAGDRARGATAYVTLEPCAHHGRTAPCADALVDAGVSRVVASALDPDPRTARRGIQHLREHGVQVDVGLGESDALRQQAGFRSVVVRGRPWTTWKYASTLDGRTATDTGHSTWITGEPARAQVHRWRDQIDAIAVGSGTVLADDPALTTRGVPGGRDARAVVFDRRGRVVPTATVVRPGTIVVTAPDARPVWLESMRDAGADVVVAGSLLEGLEALVRRGVTTLLLEGGATLAGAFLRADAIDEVRAFVAPRLLGSGTPVALSRPTNEVDAAVDLRDVTVTHVGQDVLVHGFVHSIPTLGPQPSDSARSDAKGTVPAEVVG